MCHSILLTTRLPLGPQVLVAEFKRQLKRLLEMCEAVGTGGSVKSE